MESTTGQESETVGEQGRNGFLLSSDGPQGQGEVCVGGVAASDTRPGPGEYFTQELPKPTPAV